MKLPLNCNVRYIPDFLSSSEATELYDLLMDEYKMEESRMTMEVNGKLIETESFKMLFASEQHISSNSHPAHIHGKSFPWKGPMTELKKRVDQYCDHAFELAMCLYYPDGAFSAPYHFDQLTEGMNTLLPSISLGAVRKFSFRNNNTQEEYSIELAHGSLLLMDAHSQTRYMHSLPEDTNCKSGRINITFRDANFK